MSELEKVVAIDASASLQALRVARQKCSSRVNRLNQLQNASGGRRRRAESVAERKRWKAQGTRLAQLVAAHAARANADVDAALDQAEQVEGLLNRRLRGKQKGKGDKFPGKGKDKGKDRQGPDKGKGESDDHHDDADDADADGWPFTPPILALSPFKAQVQKAVLPCEQMQADMARVMGKNSSAAALRAGDEDEDDKQGCVGKGVYMCPIMRADMMRAMAEMAEQVEGDSDIDDSDWDANTESGESESSSEDMSVDADDYLCDLDASIESYWDGESDYQDVPENPDESPDEGKESQVICSV